MRQAVPSDLDAILRVEHLCYPFPWPRSAFESEFQNRWSTIDALFVPAGDLIAFIVYWIVEDELHLLNIAVHPQYQRQALARRLLDYLDRVCLQRGLNHVALEVRVSNKTAINLYLDKGFSIVHRRKRYYVEEGEDAFIMTKYIEPPKPSPERGEGRARTGRSNDDASNR
ncbi:MAG: ribosomal protein S18-alanine N-acetyltransferase [Bradymonadales bacterium]|nr:ribosomal protein S18-alanine N-acetyltransferase [Bradymonadales bacterium]